MTKLYSLRQLFKNTFEGHRGRPGRRGGSLPKGGYGTKGGYGSGPTGQKGRGGGGAFESDKDYEKYAKGRQAGVNPELADVDMVGGHLDMRQLGERGVFGIETKFKPPQIRDEIDFYDENGDKQYGKVTDISGDTITIRKAGGDGRFSTGKKYVLKMVDNKTGFPFVY